ncbi:MAG: DinB family protein [Planctomycetes bacterium]|nr:DinB family protein [Planctomycetota bacterium]
MPSEYLDKLIQQSVELSGEVQKLTQPLSEEALHWKPVETTWSMAQLLEHMATTAELYAPGLDRLIEKASRKRPYKGEDFEPTWLGGGFAKYVGPEGEAKMKAPKRFQPAPQPESGSLARYMQQHNALEQRMRQSVDFNLRRWKIRSPAFILMRFTLGDAFALLVGHAQRHTLQMQKLRESADFPSN